MYQFIITSLLIFTLSNLFAQGNKISLQIKGAENKDVKLGYYFGGNKYIKQKGSFDTKGKYTFTSKKALPTGIYIIIIGEQGYFDILIRNENKISLSSDTSDFIQHMKIKGSKENKLFFDYQKKVISIKSEINNLQEKLQKTNSQNNTDSILKQIIVEKEDELDNLYQQSVKKYPNSYLAKILKSYNAQDPTTFNFADAELLRTPIYHTMLRLFIKQNINKQPEYIIYETNKLLDNIKNVKENYEYVANYLLNFYNTFYKNGMNEVFVYLADHYFLPDKANWFNKAQLKKIEERRKLLGQSLPGNKAPDLVLESASGEYLSLNQMDSKFVLLYFWSANCGHCTKSSTILKQYYSKLRQKNMEIFAVNTDRDSSLWKKKIESMNLEWINCHDPNEVSNFREKYYVYGTPLLYLINKKHIILSKQNGEEDIEKLIKKLAQ